MHGTVRVSLFVAPFQKRQQLRKCAQLVQSKAHNTPAERAMDTPGVRVAHRAWLGFMSTASRARMVRRLSTLDSRGKVNRSAPSLTRAPLTPVHLGPLLLSCAVLCLEEA